MYEPKCVVCGKKVTWNFYVCAECEEQYGKRVGDREEWLTFLINEERKARYRISNGKNIQYLEDSDDNLSYAYDIENLLICKFSYAGFAIEDSDGVIELQDSDWDAVTNWSGM